MATILRTLVRIRVNGEIKTADVVASCKTAGYVFLIHRADSDRSKYVATYAPVGLPAGGAYNSIAALAQALAHYESKVSGAIASALTLMQQEHMPLLSDECGIELNDWQWREQSRLDSSEYQPVPIVLDLAYPKEHYLHLSVTKTESDFVAYTPSPEYGERDRQTRMKFGKYLRKVFPHLTDVDVQKAVMDLRTALALADSPAKLLFATDRATINRIFETEMCACDSTYTSCMHGKFNNDAIRPYHVYADSPDVAVAYVLEHGKIVARSVVSTKGKEYVRAYAVGGCSTKCGILIDLLRQAGYSHGDLVGSRLTKLRTHKVMLPYIDNGGARVSNEGHYWEVVSDGGDYEADQTDGTASDCTPRCGSCDNPEDDCNCSYCECCEESYAEGCDTCSMCPVCDRCTEHRGTAECECVRCPECSELEENCECAHCEEDEEKEEENEANQSNNTPGDVAIPAASSI